MNKPAGHSQSRIDTLIGSGVRIEGHMRFTGVLLIQGDTLGDVSCDSDAEGTVVVSKTGNVTGTLIAPYIVVGGHVSGPLHSSASIEIQPGACVVGDTFYRAIDIQAGGVMHGSMNPQLPLESDHPDQLQRARVSVPPPILASDKSQAGAPSDGIRLWHRLGLQGKLAGAAALLVAAAAIMWINKGPASATPPASSVPPLAAAAPNNDSATREVSKGAEKAAVGEPASPAPNAAANARTPIQAPPADQFEINPDKVIVVQGVNPNKPSGVFLIMSKEPSVLYRKKRQDPADGMRIDVPRGAAESVSIARNEIFRVEKGHNPTIFYQGTKVAPRTIESGAWMSFAPHTPGAEGERK